MNPEKKPITPQEQPVVQESAQENIISSESISPISEKSPIEEVQDLEQEIDAREERIKETEQQLGKVRTDLNLPLNLQAGEAPAIEESKAKVEALMNQLESAKAELNFEMKSGIEPASKIDRFIPPEKLEKYIKETDGALKISIGVLRRGWEDVDTGTYKAWPQDQVKNSLDSLVQFITSKRKYYERANQPELAVLIQRQLDELNGQINNVSEDPEALEEFLGKVESTLQSDSTKQITSLKSETPIQKNVERDSTRENFIEDEEPDYEDSAQKSERLWNEYEKLAEEYTELLDILDRDRAEQQRLLDEAFSIIDKNKKELKIDASKLDILGLQQHITNLRDNTRRLVELKDDLTGIGGDVAGSFALLRNHQTKVDKITLELKALGEI